MLLEFTVIFRLVLPVMAKDILANGMLKHSLLINLYSPFQSFLFIVRNYNILHLEDFLLCHYRKTGFHAGHCFMPKIIYLPGSGHCPLARVSEPIRWLETATSPSLYMLSCISQVQLALILYIFTISHHRMITVLTKNTVLSHKKNAIYLNNHRF